jgi:hypothetical protein
MKLSFLMLSAAFFSASALAQNVDFATPHDGDTLTSPFMVRFVVKDMEVVPAGEVKPGTGHHHILIDTPAVADNSVIPADAQHKHFGKGQTETELTLPPGEHTLSLQFADGAHRSYGEAYRKTIRVTVK